MIIRKSRHQSKENDQRVTSHNRAIHPKDSDSTYTCTKQQSREICEPKPDEAGKRNRQTTITAGDFNTVLMITD